MARIEKSIDIDRTPDEVWAVVGDVGAIAEWMPPISQSSFSDGVRECTMEGGGVLREQISNYDDAARRFEYELMDGPVPLEHHHSWMSVDATDAGSRVTWITEVAPDDIAGAMEPAYEDGLQALKRHVERS